MFAEYVDAKIVPQMAFERVVSMGRRNTLPGRKGEV